jgi:hypothetical protein
VNSRRTVSASWAAQALTRITMRVMTLSVSTDVQGRAAALRFALCSPPMRALEGASQRAMQ